MGKISSLTCRGCGYEATEEFIVECNEAEAESYTRIKNYQENMLEPVGKMGRLHYLLVGSKWDFFHGMEIYEEAIWQEFLDIELVKEISETLADALVRVPQFEPLAIRFYALLSKMSEFEDRPSAQQIFLEREHSIVGDFFPHEAKLLRKLLKKLLQ